MADDPVTRQDVKDAPAWHKPRLTLKRLSGLDRSGPPPPMTLQGAPWNVWTIPNAIGFARLALIPVFLVLGLSSDDGTETSAAIVFAVIAWSDYADGIAARVTGQYSRFGALLDPFVDRLLVAAGLIVVWKFELLPRWALGVLIARELLLIPAGRYALKQGIQLQVNWWGRWAVWPTMSAIFAALVDLLTLGEILLYIGLFLSVMAVVEYARSYREQVAARQAAPSS